MLEQARGAAIATIILGASTPPVLAMTVVSCIRPATEITFQGQHMETIAAGAITGPDDDALRWPWGPELYTVGRVKVLELGDVPPGANPPEIGSVVNVLERMSCENCDVDAVTARNGIYSRTGDVLWFKAEIGPLPQAGSHLETIDSALLRAGISYQFVVDDWCSASRTNNWSSESNVSPAP